mmetsp:Transcript_12614/g.31782  ORF Transcript_12614/g.31782 Transcript_12614/m.31782 type:complete len:339 (+) Transcript_12614:209-1225(+)
MHHDSSSSNDCWNSHSFQGGNHVPTFRSVIDLLHLDDLNLGAGFVVDHLLSDAALEEPIGKGGLGKGRIVVLLVRLVVSKHFVGRGSQELLGLVVKDAHPGIGGAIRNGSGKDPFSVAVGIRTVAAIAVVTPVGRLVDLAPISAGVVRVGTRRVPGPALLVLFQKGKVGLEGKIIPLLVVFAQLLTLDIGNHLAVVESFHAAASSPTRRERLDGSGAAALGGPPHANVFCLGTIGFHKDVPATEGFAVVVADAGASKGHDLLVAVELVAKLLGRFAPQSQPDLDSRVVDECHVGLFQLLAGSLAGERLDLPDFLDDSNHVHERVFFLLFELANLAKLK